MNNNKTLTLYVLTHSESYYNKRGIFTGRVDSELSAEGHEKAKRLAEVFKDKHIDIAFTSPLSRAKETLKHILKYHPKTKVVIDERLVERDYGQLSHKSKKKYQEDHPDLFPLYHRSYDVAPPGGESMKQVEKRVLDFITEMLSQMNNDNKCAMIVAHGNSIRPIRKYFEKLDNHQMMELENSRDTYFTYHVERGVKE